MIFQNTFNSFIRLTEKARMYNYMKLKSIASLKLSKNKRKVN